MEIKPTKAQFRDYVQIQRSGETNMLNLTYVCMRSKTGLTVDTCFYIMNHYAALADEYGTDD